MNTPEPDEAPRAWIHWTMILLVSVMALAGMTMVLVERIAQDVERLRELRARAAECPRRDKPSREFFADEAPPASEPLGSTSYLAAGTDLGPLMGLRFERVRQGAAAGTVRLGSPEVLSPRAVHVISLWAPWCVACKEVLPDLRVMFARRGPSWGESVRFLPVQVLDPTAPDEAIRVWGPLMPESTVQLADRSLEDSFVAGLRDDSRRLYQGTLPVTLVLDCNRRVRWARIGVPNETELRELEGWLDTFRAELTDDPRCRRIWCGNGRCEAGEDGRCVEDCGLPTEAVPSEREVEAPLAVAVADVGEPALSSPTPAVKSRPERPRPCPKGCLRCDDEGRCLTLWEGPESPVSTPPTGCGDGKCDPSENWRTCCRDCGCEAPLKCQRTDGERDLCLPARLWPD